MAVLRCENGHFYDNAKSPDCPHCNKTEVPLITQAPAPPAGAPSGNSRKELNEERTEYLPSSGSQGTAPSGEKQNVRINMGGSVKSSADEKTVGVFRSEKGCDPVVGWLVCIDGGEKGRDYRLRVGRNFIGRGLKSDISLPDDEQISKTDHCSIVFEPKKNAYAIIRGGGESLMVNGEIIEGSCVLNDDDKIIIGSSEFVFIPYCREGRSW